MNEQALEELLELLSLEGPPGREGKVAASISERLRDMGIPPAELAHDNAHRQSEYEGDVGNLIVRIDGRVHGPRLMFSAHMDTVPDAVGCRPALDREGNCIVNEAAGRALGGDNRTGCAVLLNLARELVRLNGAHPPVTLVFFVQEEVGLVGARGLNLGLLGEPAPAMCFNLDGGFASQLVTAVIGSQRFTIKITGLAAHAGARPAEGISAAVIAARAITRLDQGGWHGRVERAEGTGTANVGIIRGGQGSNVVMPALHILAEARSHDPVFRAHIIEKWKAEFQRATEEVSSRSGRKGKVNFGPGPTYEAFSLAADEPAVQLALKAAENCGIKTTLVSNDGGMDANWIVAHGIPTVTIGPGQRQVHTAGEWIDLVDFERACQLVLSIVALAR